MDEHPGFEPTKSGNEKVEGEDFVHLLSG